MTLAECKRPASGCTAPHDRYESVDCDGDGIKDHVCKTTINANRWMVLSKEGCPASWGTHLRTVAQCSKAFGSKNNRFIYTYYGSEYFYNKVLGGIYHIDQ